MFRLTSVIVVFALFVVSGACQEMRTPNKYLIPNGYVGWVKIKYDVKSAAPLPVENGFYIIRIPPNAVLETSSIAESGWALDEFYYVSGEHLEKLKETERGGGGMIWSRGETGKQNLKTNKTEIFKVFFVGPEEMDRRPYPD